MSSQPPTLLIAGSSSEIAKAIVKRLCRQQQAIKLITLSRQCDQNHEVFENSRNTLVDHQHIQADLRNPACVGELTKVWQQLGRPDQVYHCSGILHDAEHGPEKSIRDFDASWLQQSLQANVVTHAHLAQSLHPLLTRKQPIRWLSLSAKVGSIEDNGMGGWHSYRMSKAALNMLVRNLDIEWRRKSPDSRIVAVHPGTTDTPLSEPFQAGIAADKLYSADTTAERMIEIMNNLTEQQSGKLLFWDGEVLPF